MSYPLKFIDFTVSALTLSTCIVFRDFTDSEFEKWKEICAQYNVTLPTTDQIEQKKRDIDCALNYEYKEEDVEKIIQEKNRFRAHPTNYAMKKTQLMKVRFICIQSGLITIQYNPLLIVGTRRKHPSRRRGARQRD